MKTTKESSTPALAVVGCVNMGKSSMVATLVEDDAILIAAEPGSTKACAAYDLQLGQDAVFTLIDTPGFQNARRALAWIEDYRKRHESERVTPTAAVRAFHAEMTSNPSFVHEVRLLTPILKDGAGILYVVDGTQPYMPRYEAEMRILAMTGAPRMGVINLRAAGSPHAAEWEEALRPWFKAVRFDAHEAGGEARLRLFASLRGVDDAWAPIVDEALRQLRTERAGRHELAAAAIAHLLIDLAAMQEDARLETNREAQVARLAEKLFERMREREGEARRAVEALYRHHHLERAEEALALIDKDLLDKDQWRLMGLSATQLASAGAAAGALAGGILDASVGGASFFAGTVVGAAMGGLGAVWGGRSLARVQVLGAPLGGRRLRVRPPAGAQFPFVVLDRALIHWHLVAGRAHARRDALEIGPAETLGGVVASLPSGVRKSLARHFAELSKHEGDIDDADRRALIHELRALAPDTPPKSGPPIEH